MHGTARPAEVVGTCRVLSGLEISGSDAVEPESWSCWFSANAGAFRLILTTAVL